MRYIISPAKLHIHKYKRVTFYYLECLSLGVFRFSLRPNTGEQWVACRMWYAHLSFRNLDLVALTGVPFTAAVRTFFFTTTSGTHLTSYPTVTTGVFFGVKWKEREADYLHPYTEIRNALNFSCSPSYIFTVAI